MTRHAEKVYSVAMTLTIPMLQDAVVPVLKKHGVSKAVLFGSHAKGCAHENSDVDLLVDSGLRGLAFFGLVEDLHETINRPVDVLDVTQIKKDSRIDKEIHQTGVVIYEK